MSKPTNIVLIMRRGGDFKMSDVYMLAAHINKYWASPLRPKIYCYTDTVDKETEVVGLTIRPLPVLEWEGWWSKMNLFHPKLKDLRPFMYMDLDTAVLSSLSSIIPKPEFQNNFITLKDFYRPTHLASGVMWIPNTAYMDKLYKAWSINTKIHMNKFRGDQNFIESVIKADKYWQDIYSPNTVVTFKPLNKLGRPEWRTEYPINTTLVCFHGTPRISQATSVDWVKQYVSYVI